MMSRKKASKVFLANWPWRTGRYTYSAPSGEIIRNSPFCTFSSFLCRDWVDHAQSSHLHQARAKVSTGRLRILPLLGFNVPWIFGSKYANIENSAQSNLLHFTILPTLPEGSPFLIIVTKQWWKNFSIRFVTVTLRASRMRYRHSQKLRWRTKE